MDKKLLILGAGRYGQVVKETAEAMSVFTSISFLDDYSSTAIGKISEYKSFSNEYGYAFVAIGDMQFRAKMLMLLKECGYELAILIHPKAYVSPSAILEEGTIVEAMAVVNANAVLKSGAFVCAGGIVNHDATVGSCSQIDCGSVVEARAVVPQVTKVYCRSSLN